MLACITTAAVLGLEGRLAEVQVDIAHQELPNFFLVGFPTGAAKEARERVRTAIKSSGLVFPLRRMTVNLAPAQLRKQGPLYDVPLALAILVAWARLTSQRPGRCSSASCRWMVGCDTFKAFCRWWPPRAWPA
jgi:magnesium chelatase family protein